MSLFGNDTNEAFVISLFEHIDNVISNLTSFLIENKILKSSEDSLDEAYNAIPITYCHLTFRVVLEIYNTVIVDDNLVKKLVNKTSQFLGASGPLEIKKIRSKIYSILDQKLHQVRGKDILISWLKKYDLKITQDLNMDASNTYLFDMLTWSAFMLLAIGFIFAYKNNSLDRKSIETKPKNQPSEPPPAILVLIWRGTDKEGILSQIQSNELNETQLEARLLSVEIVTFFSSSQDLEELLTEANNLPGVALILQEVNRDIYNLLKRDGLNKANSRQVLAKALAKEKVEERRIDLHYFTSGIRNLKSTIIKVS